MCPFWRIYQSRLLHGSWFSVFNIVPLYRFESLLIYLDPPDSFHVILRSVLNYGWCIEVLLGHVYKFCLLSLLLYHIFKLIKFRFLFGASVCKLLQSHKTLCSSNILLLLVTIIDSSTSVTSDELVRFTIYLCDPFILLLLVAIRSARFFHMGVLKLHLYIIWILIDTIRLIGSLRRSLSIHLCSTSVLFQMGLSWFRSRNFYRLLEIWTLIFHMSRFLWRVTNLRSSVLRLLWRNL